MQLCVYCSYRVQPFYVVPFLIFQTRVLRIPAKNIMCGGDVSDMLLYLHHRLEYFAWYMRITQGLVCIYQAKHECLWYKYYALYYIA